MTRNLAAIVVAGSAVATAVQLSQLLALHRRMYDEVHAVADGIGLLRGEMPGVVAAYVDGFRGGQRAADLADERRREQDRRRQERRASDRARPARLRADARWTSPLPPGESLEQPPCPGAS